MEANESDALMAAEDSVALLAVDESDALMAVTVDAFFGWLTHLMHLFAGRRT